MSVEVCPICDIAGCQHIRERAVLLPESQEPNYELEAVIEKTVAEISECFRGAPKMELYTRAELDAAKPPQPALWLPIKDAPRDGTQVLACWKLRDLLIYGLVRWENGGWCEDGSDRPLHEPDLWMRIVPPCDGEGEE